MTSREIKSQHENENDKAFPYVPGLSDGGGGGGGADEEAIPPTEILAVVDRSGSMTTLGNEVYMGFNNFIRKQNDLPGQVYVTLLRFDDQCEFVHRKVPIDKVPQATAQTFEPRGMTALFDAVAQGIYFMDQNMSPNARVVVVIITDGAENASQEITHNVFNRLVQARREAKWEFVFLAANQDAVKVGARFGMRPEACMTFGADERSTKCMMAAASERVFESISKNSQLEFSHLDRFSSQPALVSENQVQNVLLCHETYEDDEDVSPRRRPRLIRAQTVPVLSTSSSASNTSKIQVASPHNP